MLAVDTSDRLYDDYIRFLFLYDHREESVFANELPEESDQFQFFHTVCLAHLTSSFYPFSSSHTAFSPFPRTFSSVSA